MTCHSLMALFNTFSNLFFKLLEPKSDSLKFPTISVGSIFWHTPTMVLTIVLLTHSVGAKNPILIH